MLDKNETRPSRYGAVDAFITQTAVPGSIITPELERAATMSIGRILETPVIDYDAGVTISNTRSVTIADDENTSAKFQINFATYSWGFTSIPALHMNNEIDAQADWDAKFLKYLYKFAATLDSAAVATLDTARTQIFADLLHYTNTGDAIQVPWTERENILGDLTPIMAANDHFGDIHVIGNGGIESLVLKLAQQGVYNDKNKTLEFMDKTMHYTPRLANSVGQRANFYAVQGGSLGILTRFEREALLGTRMQDGTEWGIENLPLLNIPVGTYFYESKGDYSAIAGAASADMTRVRKEHYGFSVDIALVTPYNSDPSSIASPVVKGTILVP